MADETPPLSELVRQRDSLLALQEAMKNRLQNLSREEALEVESLSERAIHPKCSFDRKRSETLYEMALFPDQVPWLFKLRERLHRVLHHH
jgi:hypothetical protein